MVAIAMAEMSRAVAKQPKGDNENREVRTHDSAWGGGG
jgi:hypothetical protein